MTFNTMMKIHISGVDLRKKKKKKGPFIQATTCTTKIVDFGHQDDE